MLIVAGNEYIIRNDHSLEMYESINRAQLCNMPGETYFAPASNPAKFNEIAFKFLSEPYNTPGSDW